MSFRLVTVNIEGDRHLDRVQNFIAEQNPDIICCQEVFESDLPVLEKTFGMKAVFCPQVKMLIENPYAATKGEWGVALFSHLPIIDTNVFHYVGTPDFLPIFRPNSGSEDDDVVNNNTNRVGIACTVQTPENKTATIVTIHFTWSVNGESSPRQLRDVANLKDILATLPPHVLCGDTNSPRGKKTFKILSQGYIDHLPSSVTSTLDPELHRVGHKQLAVDALLAHSVYEVSNVHVHTGVSDHKAISADIAVK